MITNGIFSSKTDEWETPKDLFEKLNRIFSFELDVAANEHNKKCDRFFSKEDDGLKQSWGGCKVWCNPPYGRQIAYWVKKSAEEIEKDCPLVVMLLPARTETRWYHDYIANNPHAITVFLKGRLRFNGVKCNAPFPSMLVFFSRISG